MLLAYNLQVTVGLYTPTGNVSSQIEADSCCQVWTLMHLFFPHSPQREATNYHKHRLRNKIIKVMSPPLRANCPKRRFFFSLFYTVAHVFTFTNTILYWAVLVPSGHGGFKAPGVSHHHDPPSNSTAALYDPSRCTRHVFRPACVYVFRYCSFDTDIPTQTRGFSRKTTLRRSASSTFGQLPRSLLSWRSSF